MKIKEIKVGYFIRTKENGIAQVIGLEWCEEKLNFITLDKEVIVNSKNIMDSRLSVTHKLEMKQIESHSSNLKDLICVGDFVNGYEVSKHPEYGLCILNGNVLLCDIIIKRVLTKEQFKEREYEVKKRCI